MMDGKNRLKHVGRLIEINKLRIVASCWLYSANIIAMHGPMNATFTQTVLSTLKKHTHTHARTLFKRFSWSYGILIAMQAPRIRRFQFLLPFTTVSGIPDLQPHFTSLGEEEAAQEHT